MGSDYPIWATVLARDRASLRCKSETDRPSALPRRRLPDGHWRLAAIHAPSWTLASPVAVARVAMALSHASRRLPRLAHGERFAAADTTDHDVIPGRPHRVTDV